MHALGLKFGSAAQLFKRPGSVWNCLWRNALKRSPGIIRKSRVSYPGPGFLSSATWPSLPKKHYNGLNLNLKNSVPLHITSHISAVPTCSSLNGPFIVLLHLTPRPVTVYRHRIDLFFVSILV